MRLGYSNFLERFKADAKKEAGDRYTEPELLDLVEGPIDVRSVRAVESGS